MSFFLLDFVLTAALFLLLFTGTSIPEASVSSDTEDDGVVGFCPNIFAAQAMTSSPSESESELESESESDEESLLLLSAPNIFGGEFLTSRFAFSFTAAGFASSSVSMASDPLSCACTECGDSLTATGPSAMTSARSVSVRSGVAVEFTAKLSVATSFAGAALSSPNLALTLFSSLAVMSS